jgi:hypothetical protein
MKIIHDIFPAKLIVAPAGLVDSVDELSIKPATRGAYLVDTARVIITDLLIVIAQDSPEGPLVIFQEKYESFVKGEQSKVVTVSGKMVVYERDTNCGCGSRLRGWNVTRTLYSIQGE